MIEATPFGEQTASEMTTEFLRPTTLLHEMLGAVNSKLFAKLLDQASDILDSIADRNNQNPE